MVRRTTGALLALLLAAPFPLACQKRAEPVPTPTQDQWRRVQEAMLDEAPTLANPVDAVFGETVRLIGWEMEPATPEVGTEIRLRMYWEVLQATDERWHIFVHLDGAGRQNLDHEAIGNGYPSVYWKAGEIFVDEVRGELDPRVGNGTIRIYTGLFRDDQRLPVLRAGEGVVEDDGRLRIGTIEASWSAEEYRVRRATGTMTVDGKLDEPNWRRAQQTPAWAGVSDAAEADVTTWAKVLWDNENLYLGVYAEDPHLRGDEGAERDRIEVVIESPGDTSLLAHLTVHADGTSELQTLRASDGNPVADAEAIEGIEVAVSHDGDLGENDETDASWTAEIRVPWSALPGAESAAPISNQTTVRTNLLRVDVGGDAPVRTAWSTTGSSRFTDPSRMGVLRFTGAPRRTGAAPQRP